MAALDSAEAVRWAVLPAESALEALQTRRSGLEETEATRRLIELGPNRLPSVVRPPWYFELGAQFTHLFALLLWAGSGLAWLAGMPQLAGAIISVILINGLFSYWQEYRAERAAEALAALLPHRVKVRRGGQEREISAAEVVVGDILSLSEGEAIPADARLISCERLRVDTSSLTGESRPIPRSAGSSDATGRAIVTLPNLVLAGTTVAAGRGEAVVYATGTSTEFAHIARLTEIQEERPSPLQRQIIWMTRVVTFVAIALGTLCFLTGTMLGGLSPAAGFLFAIGIIVANVPEGLLPTMTLALALGVRRMAARKALLKRLSAVETLGATTVILTDKTGTLTENEMTVRELWIGGRRYRVSGAGYDPSGSVQPLDGPPDSVSAPWTLLRAAALCCDAHLLAPDSFRRRWQAVGDPTEAAILVAAAKVGISAELLATWPRLDELPFDSVRKRMTTVEEIAGVPVACVKGAPSEVLSRCTSVLWQGAGSVALDEQRQALARKAHDDLAGRGMRILAVAVRDLPRASLPLDGYDPAAIECHLTLLGLLAMEDPPRPEVPAAIAACRAAGVRVIMVTGDEGLTGATVGREIGLYGPNPKVITGAQLDETSRVGLMRMLDLPDLLFARVSPEHKLHLVEAFQRRGDVVAVTGDGVNDAPALKRADIGVAMGITGTDVAREAADMVLADDNFASIVVAIEEGRAVYDNVRKFVTYIFASNIPEIVPFVAFVVFRIPLPLTVMQILAVDLGTDLLPALALGTEPPEPDVMQRCPRRRQERLLDRATLWRAYGWLGLLEALFGLTGYFYAFWLAGWRPGVPMPDSGNVYLTATTMSLAAIVACQVGNVLACRSTRKPIWRLGLATNPRLLPAIALEVSLLVVLIYFPPLAGVFELAPLTAAHWGLLILFPPLLLALEEARKFFLRHRQRGLDQAQ